MLRDEEEKNAKVILSEGESEAARLINDAVKSYGTGNHKSNASLNWDKEIGNSKAYSWVIGQESQHNMDSNRFWSI